MPTNPEQSAREVAALVAREVAELPDRTSPPDEPMLLLVTERELVEIIDPILTRALAAARAEGMEAAAKAARDTAQRIKGISRKFAAGGMTEMAKIRCEALEEFAAYLDRALAQEPGE